MPPSVVFSICCLFFFFSPFDLTASFGTTEDFVRACCVRQETYVHVSQEHNKRTRSGSALNQ